MIRVSDRVMIWDRVRVTVRVIVTVRVSKVRLVERDSSVVECRTRKRESPGSNPLCNRFEVWAFSFSSRRLSRLSCINE